jgi:hypothetical protein
MTTSQLATMKQIIEAKKNESLVKITIVGNLEYTGVIRATPRNHLKMIKENGQEVFIWLASVIKFEVLDHKGN